MLDYVDHVDHVPYSLAQYACAVPVGSVHPSLGMLYSLTETYVTGAQLPVMI